jgi:hypothetical protein
MTPAEEEEFLKEVKKLIKKHKDIEIALSKI